MPRVTVDGVELEVPQGATVLHRGWLIAFMLVASLAPSPSRADALQDMKDKHLALAELSNCVVGTRLRASEAALTADPRTTAFDDWFDKNASGECHLRVAESVGFWFWPPENIYRYGLAETVFRAELSTTRLRDLQSVAPLAHGLSPRRSSYDRIIPGPPTPEQIKAEDAAYLYLSEMAECTIRANPDGVFDVLSAEFMSDAEDRAFAAIAPKLGSCTDSTRKLTIDRESMRGALALEYVRLARAPRVAIPPGGAVK